MIDNRPIIPAGSRLALTETSEKVIVMWNVDSDGYRHHAMYRHKDLKPVVCRDFFKSVPNESPPTSWRWYHSRELAEQNHQENSRHFGSAGHAECQKVLLCGGGPSAAGMKTEIETARSLGYHVIVGRHRQGQRGQAARRLRFEATRLSGSSQGPAHCRRL